MTFNYEGNIASSKSLYNRALILKSYNSQIQVFGTSQSEDINVLSQAVIDLENGKTEFDCGEAGTAFRFWVMRLSRLPGTWKISGRERLLARPHAGLLSILEQVGVEVLQTTRNYWILKSNGWNKASRLFIDQSESSQFLSAVLLNSWKLDRDLEIQFSEDRVSTSYAEMTKQLCEKFGLKINSDKNSFFIQKDQKPVALRYQVEADMSSSFAIAACAVMGGQVVLFDFPDLSVQPDFCFLKLLQQMGIQFEHKNARFKVSRAEKLLPIKADLNNTPDLFPVLAVLLSQASGTSELTGIEHLVHKESNRILNTQKLLTTLGRQSTFENGVFRIHGFSEDFRVKQQFDPDQDHRMAMAAQVANLRGAQLKILNKEVVHKSFSDFWKIVDVQP